MSNAKITKKGGSSDGGIWNILGVKPNAGYPLDTESNSMINPKGSSTASLKARASRCPATERLVIVGQSTTGKRTVLDRLKKASEMSSATGSCGGDTTSKKGVAAHLVQKRELHQPFKTKFGAHHGCGALYGSIAFYYDDNLYGGGNRNREGNIEGSQIGSQLHYSHNSNTTTSSKVSNVINNCIMEVFICDNFEAIDSAFPDIDSLISTVVIFVVDSMEISSASNVLHTWVRAVNDRVRLLIDKENNTGKSKSSGGVSLHSGVGQSQSNDKKIGKSANSLFKSSYAPFFSDVHSLVEQRKTEWEMEKSAISSIMESFFEGHRQDKEWMRMVAENEESPIPSFPDSMWCLLPSILMMNKLDLLEDATKSMVLTNTAGASGPKRIAPISAALQHGRWLAMQRGSAFVAVSSKSHNNSVDAVFYALWRYIVYGMVPQALVRDHVKFHKLLNLKGGAGDGGGGIEEEESRREIAAMQRRAAANVNTHNLDKSIGDGSIDGDSTNNVSVCTDTPLPEESVHKDLIEEEEKINGQLKQLNALLCDEEIASTYSILPVSTGGGQTLLFLPRGLDSPSLVMQGAVSVKYIEITFGSLAAITSCLYNVDGFNGSNSVRSDGEEGDVSIPSQTSHIAYHTGKQMHEVFCKQMKAECQNGGVSRNIIGAVQGQASGGNPSQSKVSSAMGNLQSMSDGQNTIFPSVTGGKVGNMELASTATFSDGEAMIWDE
eukprot:Tbor_TRINITY_DN64_c0_g1::TRINITY_DN64_c0_g1_i1::g.15093::m.15093